MNPYFNIQCGFSTEEIDTINITDQKVALKKVLGSKKSSIKNGKIKIKKKTPDQHEVLSDKSKKDK